MNELHIGDRVKVTGTVVGIDKSDIVWPYCIDFGDIPRWLNKDVIIELVPPAVPPGWFPADVPPKDSEKSEANRDIEIMLKDGFTGKGWYGPKGHNWRIYFYPKDIVDDDILCWRELEPPKPTVPSGWTSADEPPMGKDQWSDCNGIRLDYKRRNVRVLVGPDRVEKYGYYDPYGKWYTFRGELLGEENSIMGFSHEDNVLAWKELEPPAPARRFKPGDRVKNDKLGYTGTFDGYRTPTGDELFAKCNCYVLRDDGVTDAPFSDRYAAEESNLELIPPAPAKPEYHKGDRVWLHHNGEVQPATFKRSWWNGSGAPQCRVKRDDRVVNNIGTGHTGSKPGWYTTLDFIEPMADAEDPRE